MARILVIDDEPVLRITFRHILEEEGHEVLDAEDGAEGVDMCRAQHPDLVITDLIMPKLEGTEAVAIMTKEFPAMPVIAMSGAGARPPREWMNGGQVRFVAKPVDRPALLDLVNKLLVTRTSKPTKGDRSTQTYCRGDHPHAT